ncbi:putative N-acetylglucosaminyl-phosphatidylinositol de-N-acetylase [Babesia sp. Xinjiang]|uniref:putative N-acetylglucosaminyl-phosphatidylinositol de-N-acetylase n=1 Tax=Babesia sp. Xinjiang TaxID=462227 RepID=UPI000A2613A3|nr:putative N-acetylglucosaminyl-phosphatidylinositol de-N-acetylase [Babesia sp. Xinjiang]ORM40052.1 putative N-acetylglucosaminyl-phosphatidylinositol de-N-acetylase [Babesia sp. Xinjiang]
MNVTFTKDLLAHFDSVGGDTKSIAFVIAHPDDESMFFTPLLEVLTTSPDVANQQIRLKLLSLTKGGSNGCSPYRSGDYMGQGDKRIAELAKICEKYNIKCTVDDEPDTQDGPYVWDLEKVSYRIEQFLQENNVTLVFTFDQYGVSGHPNHISAHKAAANVKERYSAVDVWCLKTYGIITKYFPPLAILRSVFRRPSVVRFSPFDVDSNMEIYHTQKRWYTKLWAFCASYSYVNSFELL